MADEMCCLLYSEKWSDEKRCMLFSEKLADEKRCLLYSEKLAIFSSWIKGIEIFKFILMAKSIFEYIASLICY